MQRKWKIVLSISISLIVIVGGFLGIAKLLNYIKYNKPTEIESEADPPILELIFENTSLISKLEGYGYLGSNFHNGIDFFINATAKIIAPCNMSVTEVVLVYLENADHWAVRTSYIINKDYYMIIGFESFARNETLGNIQLDSIIIELDQEITQGQLIGELLIHEPSAHIHFGLYKGVNDVCPYQYFSTKAKAIFDAIWSECHPGDNPCNITAITS